jgi:Transposase IS116/IS110/IS902 family
MHCITDGVAGLYPARRICGGVEVRGDGDLGVAQRLGDHLQGDAGIQRHARVGVAQVVQPGPLGQRPEVPGGELGSRRAAVLAGEHRPASSHTEAIEKLTNRIEVVIEPFRGFRKLTCTIPGISTGVADVITAETGADMSRFPTPGHLASWAGTCPGSNESAGRVKSTKTRPGNPYLKAALGTAALSVSQSKGTYLAARYRRIASRRAPIKAVVAIEHTMLTMVWQMATTGALYDDPGPDF